MSRKDKELIDLKEAIKFKFKFKFKHDKEVSLKKERKFIDQEKKDIEKVKSNLNRKKEELDKKNQKIEAEFNNLKEQYTLKSEEYLLQIEKQNAEIESLKAKQSDLEKTNDTTEKLKIELRSKDDSLLALQLENNRHLSLLKQKEEDIKDYKDKLDAAGIKDTMKENHKRIDKLIIKQKQEEIAKLKEELSNQPRKRKRVGSADKSDITSDGTDLTPVDMEIVTEIESEQIRKQKEDLNIRILEAETKLKHDVADVVKACINKYYISPRQSVPAEKSFFIRSPEEFSQLAERFSRQFREEVVGEHSQTHSSVEGVLLTQQHKKVMVEQILFYFNVREEVYAKLASLLSPSSARFLSMYRQMTDSLSRQLTDSHLAMSSSGQGLVMTDDHRLCIRQMVDRQGR